MRRLGTRCSSGRASERKGKSRQFLSRCMRTYTIVIRKERLRLHRSLLDSKVDRESFHQRLDSTYLLAGFSHHASSMYDLCLSYDSIADWLCVRSVPSPHSTGMTGLFAALSLGKKSVMSSTTTLPLQKQTGAPCSPSTCDPRSTVSVASRNVSALRQKRPGTPSVMTHRLPE